MQQSTEASFVESEVKTRQLKVNFTFAGWLGAFDDREFHDSPIW